MKRLAPAVLLLLLALSIAPVQVPAHAAGSPQISVLSAYTLNRYGYATINVTVGFSNNSNSTVPLPSVQVGLGNLSGLVLGSTLTGSGFSLTSPAAGGPFTVQPSQGLAPGGTAGYTLAALVSGVVSIGGNGSIDVLTFSGPSLNVPVQQLTATATLPSSTLFVSPPEGMQATPSGTSTYFGVVNNVTQPSAITSVRAVAKSSLGDFNPLEVFSASRSITVGIGGVPEVTDSLHFKNLSPNAMTTIYVDPLTTRGEVTVVPAQEPKLLNPSVVTLAGGGITLTSVGAGYSVPAGSNYTISYQYPLDRQYYTVSGGKVTLNLPERPPIGAVVDTYLIKISTPTGISVTTAAKQVLAQASPWDNQTVTLGYRLAYSWAVVAGVPTASVVFVLLLLGLFVTRTTTSEEAEEEEESSTERASAMIKAFEDKSALINGLWSEIQGRDPNQLNKAFFDELRGRLDTFRSKALQRLNEVKQMSTTQKFFELLNQIHTTEREVDRAAKDKLNLYEQYYMKRMRREVYDRLLPQYTRRLEKALNQLSDELHTVQREAKLL